MQHLKNMNTLKFKTKLQLRTDYPLGNAGSTPARSNQVCADLVTIGIAQERSAHVRVHRRSKAETRRA